MRRTSSAILLMIAASCVVVSALADQAEPISTIADEHDVGCTADEHLANYIPPNPLTLRDPLNIQITQIEISRFPTVQVATLVSDANGDAILGLTEADFTLTEQGPVDPVPVVELIDVTPLSGTSGAVSIALVFDRSGSMNGSKIQQAKVAARTFIDNFADQDRAALVSFSSSVTADQQFLFTDLPGKQTIKDAINRLNAGGGTALIDGVIVGVNLTAGEPGTKAVIVFTDGQENSSSHTLQDAVSTAVAANIPVYTIGLGSGANQSFLTTLAHDTGGEYYYAPSASQMAAIYAAIKQSIQAQYLLVYDTHRPVEDGTTRTVTTTVDYAGNTASDSKNYVAHLPPRIIRTQETVELSFVSQVPAQSLAIEANVLGSFPTTAVKLYYRGIGSGTSYTEVNMSPQGGSLYHGIIHAGVVVAPGVEYYITASDGVLTSTDPAADPLNSPHQIPVGQAGFGIQHVPVILAPYGVSVDIAARVVDLNSTVTAVKLFCRHANDVLYQESEMLLVSGTGTDGIYLSAIPATVHSGPPGCDYYIEASNADGRIVRHGTPEVPHRVNYEPRTLILGAYWDRTTRDLSLSAWAFDPTNGAPVTIGAARFVVYDASATPIRIGHLAYDTNLQRWISNPIPFDEQGTFTYEVNVNGLVGRISFVAGIQETDIGGTVREGNGAPVSGATVELLNQVLVGSQLQWNVVETLTSLGDGSFAFATQPAGVYWINAEKQGLHGRSGPFYAIGLIIRDVTMTDFGVPIQAIDDVTSKLLDLMDSHVDKLSEKSKTVDEIVSGSDLWSKGVDVADTLKLIVTSVHSLGKAAKELHSWSRAATYWRQAKEAGGGFDVMIASGISNVAKAEAEKAMRKALKGVAVDWATNRALALMDATVLTADERRSFEVWTQKTVGASHGKHLGQNYVVATTFDEVLSAFYVQQILNNLDDVRQSVEFLIPTSGANVEFNERPWLQPWPPSARNHYRDPAAIRAGAPIYAVIRDLLTNPNTGLADVYKTDLVTLNAHPDLNMLVMQDIFAWTTNQIDLIREHTGNEFLTLYGEPLPVNLNDSLALYQGAVDHVNNIMVGKTLKVAADIAVAAVTIASAGVATPLLVAYSAGSFVLDVTLQLVEHEARMAVMGQYIGLSTDWAMAQLEIPAVLERAYTYAVTEILDPMYAVSNPSYKFQAAVDNVDIHPDYISPLTSRQYVLAPLGFLLIGNRDIDFRVRNIGSEEAHARVIIENRVARLFNPDDFLSSWQIFPDCMSDVNPQYEEMGVRLQPSEQQSATLEYKAHVDIANLFEANRVLLKPYMGPFAGSAHVEEYWVCFGFPPPFLVPDRNATIEEAIAFEQSVRFPAVVTGEPLTLYAFDKLANRTVRLERGSGVLSMGNAIYTESYTAPPDVWSVRFVLHHPVMANAQLHIYEGGDHVGWADDLGSVEYAFPAVYSGDSAVPESIEVPQAANRTFTIEARLVGVNSDLEFPIRVEVREEPIRPDAVLVTDATSVNISVPTDVEFSVTSTIAEASQQHPVLNLTASVSDLADPNGTVLDLLAAETPALYNEPIIPAGETRHYEWRYHSGQTPGVFSGDVTYTSDSGDLAQTVEIVVAGAVGQLVTVTHSDLRWDRATGQSYATVTIANTSATTISAPIFLAIDDVTPAVITPIGADGGFVDGRPYFEFSSQMAGTELAPGDEVSQQIAFDNPDRLRFRADVTVHGIVGSLPGGPAPTFAVGALAAGDLDCSGTVDFADINPFIQALTNPLDYGVAHPDCDASLGDVNRDGSFDFGDINPFIALLLD